MGGGGGGLVGLLGGKALTVCMSMPSCRLTMILEMPASKYFHLQTDQHIALYTEVESRLSGDLRGHYVLPVWSRGHLDYGSRSCLRHACGLRLTAGGWQTEVLTMLFASDKVFQV